MPFVMRCLAVKDSRKPIASRCKNQPTSANGILCKGCYAKAKQGPIDILMHKDVTKTFGIPFKNQISVTINLSGKNHNPESNSVMEDKIRHAKNHLREKMSDYDIETLKEYYDRLGIDNWDKLTATHKTNEYAFKYYVIKNIIEKMLKNSTV
jgi:hypothetical protein